MTAQADRHPLHVLSAGPELAGRLVRLYYSTMMQFIKAAFLIALLVFAVCWTIDMGSLAVTGAHGITYFRPSAILEMDRQVLGMIVGMTLLALITAPFLLFLLGMTVDADKFLTSAIGD